jgi:hypothetical protein
MANHTTSLEISKRLKELGVPQKSEFWWALCADENSTEFNNGEFRIIWVGGKWNKNSIVERYSAFLATELLEMLPDRLDKNGMTFYIQITKQNNNQFVVVYCNSIYGKFLDGECQWETNLPNALALMLEYLIKKQSR